MSKMRIAALDLGSNSFLCLIAEGNAKGIQNILSDKAKVVRLGQGVGTFGVFHPEALLRAKICLQEFKVEMDRYQPQQIIAVATSAARDAKNKEELFQIGRDLGFLITIIDGSEEAETTYLGAISGLEADLQALKSGKKCLVVDIGGGSTEFISGEKKDSPLSFTKSIDIGCVRLTERFLPQHSSSQGVLLADQDRVKDFIMKELIRDLSGLNLQEVEMVVAVAGTPTALAMLELARTGKSAPGKFAVEKMEGLILEKEQLNYWLNIFTHSSVDDLVKNYQIERGRADVIYMGTLILISALDFLRKDQLQVSARGVRYGLVAKELHKIGFKNDEN